MRTIDITPTWAALVPVFVAILSNPNARPEAIRDVQAELNRMARAADLAVAKEKGADHENQ